MENSDGTLYFTGRYQGDALRYVHQGVIGKGSWDIYSGSPNDRTRLTISDTGGVQQILLMDQGHRMTVSYVGRERVEYRVYDKNLGFKLGSVLYRDGSGWRQGLMLTEAFGGYARLVSVTDVSARIRHGMALQRAAAAGAPSAPWGGFSLMSTAYAQESSWFDLARRAFREVIQDDFLIAARIGADIVSGIATATLGPAATADMLFTAGGAVLEVAGGAAGVVLSAPVILVVGAVGVGIAGGLYAADHFYGVAGGRAAELKFTSVTHSAAHESDYQSYTRPSAYGQMRPPLPPAPTEAFPIKVAAAKTGALPMTGESMTSSTASSQLQHAKSTVALPQSQASVQNSSWDGMSNQHKEDVYSFAMKNSGSDKSAPAAECMKSVSIMEKSGNSVVDTRCALVAFEVCMNKSIGTISQSQDSKKQCSIIKGIGGANACQQPCIDAVKLPTGGSGSVTTKEGSYTKLTSFAVSCYNKAMGNSNVNQGDETCSRNEALECLMNGSSLPDVNAAIQRERKNACRIFDAKFPHAACTPCKQGGGLRVDYDQSKIDIDAEHCNPEFVNKKYCVMPSKK